MTLSDYLRVLWRWKWVIVVAVCVSTLAAYFYSARQPAQYQTSAQLVYVQPVDPTNPLAPVYSSYAQDLAIQSVTNAVGMNPAIDKRAGSILGGPITSGYGVSATAFQQSSSSSSTAALVSISVTSTNPREAARVANAYAQAVVDWRKFQQLDRLRLAKRAVRAKLKTFTSVARRRTTDYLTLKENLQNLGLLETAVAPDLQIIAPAFVPTEPFAPQPRRSAALGFGVGLLAGIGLAFLFNQLTTRVRGRREVGEALGLPVIGAIPDISGELPKDGRLVALKSPDGAVAEALRLVRSNLDYVNVDDVSSLLVTSPLGGEGASTTVCNLAVTMAMAGKRIVVVDGDLRKPRVHEYFNIANDVGLSSVVAGTATLADALRAVDLPSRGQASAGGDGSRPDAGLRVTNDRRLVVLTAGPRVSDPGELVASQRFGSIIRDLQDTNVDFVIVDSPALLEVGDASAMASRVEGLIVVVNLHEAHRLTLQEAKDVLAPLPCKKLGAVLVGAKPGRGYYRNNSA